VHTVVVCLRPLYDVIDSDYLLVGQNRLLEGPTVGHIHLSRNPRSLLFLCMGKFPLPRDKEVFALPVPVARILGIELDELPPLGLEIINPQTTRILLNPIDMKELPHCHLVFLAQDQRPQHQPAVDGPPGVRCQLVGSQVEVME
jgi:hypothetical protein